jgi:hypothetical protein
MKLKDFLTAGVVIATFAAIGFAIRYAVGW